MPPAVSIGDLARLTAAELIAHDRTGRFELAGDVADRLAPVPVRDLSVLGLDPEAREAACFAVLAWAHLRGLPANAPEATGAAGARVLGSFTPGRD